MSVHVKSILLNELEKRDQLHLFFATSLMNSIQEHECKFYLSHDIRNT